MAARAQKTDRCRGCFSGGRSNSLADFITVFRAKEVGFEQVPEDELPEAITSDIIPEYKTRNVHWRAASTMIFM